MPQTADTAFWPTPGTVPPWGIPVPQANNVGVSVAGDPGAGNRRGLIIFCHPSQASDKVVPLAVPSQTNGAIAVADFASTGTPNAAGSGWVTWYPAQPVDYSIRNLSYSYSMANMVSADTATNGALLVKVYVQWLAKLRARAMARYNLSAPPPTIVGGFSLGAWVAAQLALNAPSSVVGYFCHALPTLWDQLYLSPIAGNPWTDFQGVNCAGINLGTTALSGVSLPGIIGHAESGIAITAVSLTGTALTVTTATTPPWVAGTTQVTIDSAAGGTWGTAGTSGAGINGTWAVASGSGTSWVLTYTNGGTAPTGTYTASSGQSLPSGVYTDGVVGWTSGTTPPSNGSQIVGSAGNAVSYASREGNTAYPNAHLFFNNDASRYASWVAANFTGGGFPAYF